METPFTSLLGELRHFGRAQFVDVIPRDHRATARQLRRRRLAVAGTLVVGATLLAVSLRAAPGSQTFTYASVALAITWVAGSFASGPMHLGWAHTRAGDRHVRPVLTPILLGLGCIAVFLLGALVVAQIPPLRDSVDAVLVHAQRGSFTVVLLITLVNGIAEELFFRGALYSAVTSYPVVITTVIYTLTTIATGSIMLVFAAALLGLVVGLQRRVSGGILAPILTHVIWSTGMLVLLPSALETLG